MPSERDREIVSNKYAQWRRAILRWYEVQKQQQSRNKRSTQSDDWSNETPVHRRVISSVETWSRIRNWKRNEPEEESCSSSLTRASSMSMRWTDVEYWTLAPSNRRSSWLFDRSPSFVRSWRSFRPNWHHEDGEHGQWFDTQWPDRVCSTCRRMFSKFMKDIQNQFLISRLSRESAINHCTMARAVKSSITALSLFFFSSTATMLASGSKSVCTARTPI